HRPSVGAALARAAPSYSSMNTCASASSCGTKRNGSLARATRAMFSVVALMRDETHQTPEVCAGSSTPPRGSIHALTCYENQAEAARRRRGVMLPAYDRDDWASQVHNP